MKPETIQDEAKALLYWGLPGKAMPAEPPNPPLPKILISMTPTTHPTSLPQCIERFCERMQKQFGVEVRVSVSGAASGVAGADAVLAAVSTASGVAVGQIRGKSREQAVVNARHVAALLCRKYCGLSLKQTASLLGYGGGQCHVSVLHAVRSATDLMTVGDQAMIGLHHTATRLLSTQNQTKTEI